MNSDDEESTVIELTQEPLDVGQILSTLMQNNSKSGALSTFIGTTRDSFNGKRVRCLSYEAYKPLAEKTLWQLAKQCRHIINSKGGNDLNSGSNNPTGCFSDRLLRIVIYHRLGQVPVGQPSVLIAVTSVHRKSAMRAVEFLIDELKAQAAIWKREEYEDGTAEWKENCCHNPI